MEKTMNEYTWTMEKRVTEFTLHDFGKWAAQNGAECIDYVQGCLIDNFVMACKRGTAFIFEEYANTWTSKYRVYFIPYKEQENNPEYDALWKRFEELREQAETL